MGLKNEPNITKKTLKTKPLSKATGLKINGETLWHTIPPCLMPPCFEARVTPHTAIGDYLGNANRFIDISVCA